MYKNLDAERLFNAEFDLLKERSVFKRSKSLQAIFCPVLNRSGAVCAVLRVFRNHEKKDFSLQERATVAQVSSRLGSVLEALLAVPVQIAAL